MISNLAYIHPDAKLGANVTVEPFAYIAGDTVIGALSDYLVSPNPDFQPMNANFGILPPLTERIKDKKERYRALAGRALASMRDWAAKN